jgi:hypothetical protein
MSDRELLEKAAKAADMQLGKQVFHENGNLAYWENEFGLIQGWNPLASDADAFRLAVKLWIDIPWQTFNAGADDLALIRRAIVRAAAALAEAKEQP